MGSKKEVFLPILSLAKNNFSFLLSHIATANIPSKNSRQFTPQNLYASKTTSVSEFVLNLTPLKEVFFLFQ